MNDDPYTKIYGKKGTAIISYNVGHSGSGSFAATGLNGTGLTLNSATGILSGTPILAGTSNITVTATGSNPSGIQVTDSKVYTIVISDPSSFPYRMDLTLSGYTGSSTLTDFPVLVEFSSSISGFSYNGFLDEDGDGVPTVEIFVSMHQMEKNFPTKLLSGIPLAPPVSGLKHRISGSGTVINAVGKAGTAITPDYTSNDPVCPMDMRVWH